MQWQLKSPQAKWMSCKNNDNNNMEVCANKVGSSKEATVFISSLNIQQVKGVI